MSLRETARSSSSERALPGKPRPSEPTGTEERAAVEPRNGLERAQKPCESRSMRRSLGLLVALLLGVALGRASSSLPASAQPAGAREQTDLQRSRRDEGSEDLPARAVEPVPEGQPRYLAALRAEIDALGLDGACEADDAQRAHCAVVVRGETSRRTFDVRMAYSDVTDTVYFYVDHYLVARPSAPATDALLRRLMELNWRMLVGKFEWDPSDGEVRLAAVLNTDSNFDRRAFRSVLRAVQDQADRLYPELTRVLTQP